jgi:hypothetical protein
MSEPGSLTLENYTCIAAFLQQLESNGDAGQQIDEETLALRMLALSHSDADYNADHIQAAPTSDSNTRVAMAAGGGGDLNDLMKMLTSDTKSPEEQVADGQAPKPPPVVIEDVLTDDDEASYDKTEAKENFALLKDANSVIQILINIMLMQTNPEGFDITSQAAQAFNVQAKLAFNAMMAMGGVYNFNAGVHTKHSFQIPKSQVHDKLLETMFDGMMLEASYKKQIDTEITNFIKALKNIKLDGPHSNTDFALRFGLTPAIDITAGGPEPIWQFEPITYLIYLKLDANSFNRVIDKKNSEDTIDFVYEHTVTKCELNPRNFRKMRAKYEAVCEKVMGMSLDKYGDMLNKKIKK